MPTPIGRESVSRAIVAEAKALSLPMRERAVVAEAKALSLPTRERAAVAEGLVV